MKRTLSGAWAGVVCLLCAASLAAQQADFGQASPNLANSFSSSVPRLVKFSGALKDLTGKPLSGPVEITFAIYKEQGDAAPLWQETQTVALDEQGRYTVLLGAMQGEGLPMELFATGGARWLGIQAQGAEAQPRVLLVSVPYALKAGDAETLSGKPVSDFVLAQQLKEQVQTEVAQQAKKQQDRGQQALAMVLSQGPTPMLTTQGQTSFTCPSGTSGDCVTVTQRSTGRALYALANSSAEALRVNQNGTGYGLLAVVAASGAVYGVSTATTGSGFAIRGESASTEGRGILGLATATTGGTIGLWGNAASTGGTGLLGDATAATGYTYGLRGRSYSSSGTGILAYTVATTGTTKGLWAEVYSADGTAAVFQNTASGKLVSGLVGSGTEVFSVAGTGNLVSAGTLSGTRLISTVASGTAPLAVTSTTLVPNLYVSRASLADSATTAGSATTAASATNADTLDGLHAAAFARLVGGNSFFDGQTINGSLTLTGSINNALRLETTAGTPNVIGGLTANTVTSGVQGATVSGGGGGSGAFNQVTDDFGTVGGGYYNQAGDGGGSTSDKPAATVGGGVYNTASGSYATVPGGYLNTAQGAYSLAAGRRAKANYDGDFVWGDSTDADVASTGPNQFVVRASGGAIFSNDVSAASFHGDGAGLTNVTATSATSASALSCTGCVGNTQLGVNYAASASQGGNAANALLLNGLASSAFQPAGAYATLGANTFTGTQAISSGDLSVGSGDISLPQTTSASAGVINLGGSPLIHACCDATHYNTFVGSNAGNFTTTAWYNTASGAMALSSNTSGSSNTASGTWALSSNTSGGANTASGWGALGSNSTGVENTASGHQVLYLNTTGSDNTASGYRALYYNCQNVSGSCTGNFNTAVGYNAGVTATPANANVTGGNNTFIGSGSGPGTSTPINNATAIGANALVSASNALVLGGTGDYAVNVGIGTQTPAYTLDVVGNINASGSVTASSFVGALSGTATDLNCTGCVTEAKLAFDPATQAELDIEAAARADGLSAEAVTRASADALLQTDINGRVLKSGDTMTGTLNLPADGLVVGSNQLVATGGKVGIGVSGTPAEKLEVNGTVKATGFSGDGSGLTNIQGSQIVNTVNTLQVALLKWYPANQAAAFPVGTSPAGVAFDGANIWVANVVSNNVTKLRASDGANLGAFSAGTQPNAVAFDGANVWVANYQSNNVTKVRASDGANLGTFAVGTHPTWVAFDGANIWVTNINDNTVTKLRASDGANLGNFAVGISPRGVAFDGANIWVVNSGSANVTKLRASDGANLGTFAVGSSPIGVAFDGANIWVANMASNNVTKLRASDGANLGTFAVGSLPTAVAFDGANIWVANEGSATVSKL